MGENLLLVYSSLIFLTNFSIAYLYKRYIYSALFMSLTITSVIFHSGPNIYTNIMDKFAIIGIVLYALVNLYHNILFIQLYYSSIILASFTFVIIVFFYGYHTNQYCFDNDKTISNYYHMALHIVSSVSHHMIILCPNIEIPYNNGDAIAVT